MKTREQERAAFERVKAEILAGVEAMRRANPAAAEYFEQHLVIDEQGMTFKYTGDGGLKLERMGQG
jgi:hypothetical protein